MNFNSPVARSLVALVAITGVSGTAARTASAKASTAAKAKTHKSVKAAKKVAAPDLVAHSLHVDFSDDGFDVNASVTNVGNRASATSYVSIVLSADQSLSNDDIVLQNYQLPKILAHVWRTFDTDVPLPDDLGDGSQYLLVCADGVKDIAESNEKNNCASQLLNSADVSSTDDASSDGTSADGSL